MQVTLPGDGDLEPCVLHACIVTRIYYCEALTSSPVLRKSRPEEIVYEFRRNCFRIPPEHSSRCISHTSLGDAKAEESSFDFFRGGDVNNVPAETAPTILLIVLLFWGGSVDRGPQLYRTVSHTSVKLRSTLAPQKRLHDFV